MTHLECVRAVKLKVPEIACFSCQVEIFIDSYIRKRKHIKKQSV